MATKTTQQTRPWYCNDRLVEEYYSVLTGAGGQFRMLKALKVLRSIIVNIGIITIAMYVLYEGADPTWIGFIAIFTLGAYNGVEMLDYIALIQAYSEVQVDDSKN